MVWYGYGSAVGVLEGDVATALPNGLEAQGPERFTNLAKRQWPQAKGHASRLNVDLGDLDAVDWNQSGAFQVKRNGVLGVGERFFLRVALSEATRQCRDRDDPDAVLVLLKDHIDFHYGPMPRPAT